MKINKQVDKKMVVNINDRGSLSENGEYPQVCMKAVNDDIFFDTFGSNASYNRILEHVDYIQGKAYIKEIDNVDLINKFKSNDLYGGPTLCEFDDIGRISPTTLRYVKVLKDLMSHFTNLNMFDVVEIGVGYGGQCNIVNHMFNLKSYKLIDIEEALSVSKKYLSFFSSFEKLEFCNMSDIKQQDNNYDLVISNYAFSELNRELQDFYLDKVIRRSKRGYITFNDINPDSFNSYSRDDLLKIIPGSKFISEVPLTHENNSIILWGLSS